MTGNNRIGNASEMAVAADLTRVGDVSLPIGQPAYDLVFDDHGALYRIQVKTAQRTGQRNDAHSVHVKHGSELGPYSVDEFDILAVVPNDMDGVAYYPWNESHQTITIWFDREAGDFRPCNRGSANTSEQMGIFDAIEKLK